MEHIVQFGINIDDDAIRRVIEQNALAALVCDLKKEIKQGLPKKYSETDWSQVAYKVMNDYIEEHKEEVMQAICDSVYEKVKRTKLYKEAIENGIEEGMR